MLSALGLDLHHENDVVEQDHNISEPFFRPRGFLYTNIQNHGKTIAQETTDSIFLRMYPAALRVWGPRSFQIAVLKACRDQASN